MDRGIARFADGITDYRPVWPVIEDDFYSLEARQFQSEGVAGGGEKWAPLSPEYAGYKEAHFPGAKILERKGDLARSLSNANDPNAVHIRERKMLTLGTRVPYARYHQEGTKHMPARPEIQFPEPFKRMAMAHVQQHLVQMATKMGFRSGRVPGAPFATSSGNAENFRRAMGLGW